MIFGNNMLMKVYSAKNKKIISGRWAILDLVVPCPEIHVDCRTDEEKSLGLMALL